jgi:S-DNA-T family DNA segregation ATPase FtsK/SpoIIIE
MTAKELQQPEPPSLKSLKPYKFPPLDLLDAPKKESSGDFLRFTEEVARKLTAALKSFKVEANVVGVQRGPSITMLEIELAAGTKLTRLRALEDDLAMALAAQSVRIVAPIPGKSTAGIEIPNETREVVRMSELLQAQAYNFSPDASNPSPISGTPGRNALLGGSTSSSRVTRDRASRSASKL